MDPVTLSMAKKYSNKKGGYIEGSIKTLTWDGDTTDAIDLGGIPAIKIADEVIDLNTVSSVTLKDYTDKIFTVDKSFLQVLLDEGLQLLLLDGFEVPFLLSMPNGYEEVGEKGVYITLYAKDLYWVESVTFDNRIIHPIDPIYLPEGGFGYTEYETFTYDGNGEVNGEGFFKISDTPIDVHAIRKFILSLNPELAAGEGLSSTYEFTQKNLVIMENTSEQMAFIDFYGSPMPMVVSILNADTDTGFDVGAYIISQKVSMDGGEPEIPMTWVSQIEFAKATHSIDPKYLPEGGFGYMEPPKTIEYDGIFEGKLVIADAYVKIADEAVDLNNVTSLYVYDDGETNQYGKEELDTNIAYSITILRRNGDSRSLALSVPFPTEIAGDAVLPIGTYVIDMKGDGTGSYVTKIEIGETIHPIDPKFLSEISLDGGNIASKEYVDQLIIGAMEASY